MSSGSAKSAMNQVGIDRAYAKSFNKGGIADRNTLFPFLQDEIKNPQGFGQDTVNQMLTQGGEAVSGVTGAANEDASLLASRTGNTAALPGLIGANSRNAMKQQSGNALGVNLANANLKQQQQQTGVSQLGQLYGEDTNDVLKSLGLVNDSLGAWTQGKTAAQNATMGWTKTFGDLAMGGAALGCWIAAAVYGGWDHPRVGVVRQFIFNDWAKRSPVGRLVAKLYLKFGESLAEVVKRQPVLKYGFRKLFDLI